MAYLYMPLLFCAIGYFVLYFTLAPFVVPVISSMNLIISESRLDHASRLDSIFKGSNDLDNIKTVNEKDIDMPTYGTHYARLEIKSVSVATDLYFGDSSAVLKKGVGQYIGSFIPGYGRPLLIGGHNNRAFNSLQFVKKGDIVKITTNYGKYEYKITGTRIVDHKDKSAYDLSQQNEQLILYTCYPFDTLGLTSKRFFVYADKVSGPIIVPAN
jgi:sortase A